MIRVESVYSCSQNFCSLYQRKQSGQQKNRQSKFSSFQKALEKEMTKKRGSHYETRA